MKYSNTTSLDQRDLQQVSGGTAILPYLPICILYVPGYPTGGATPSLANPITK